MLQTTLTICSVLMFFWLFWFVSQYADLKPMWAIGVSSDADRTHLLDVKTLAYHPKPNEKFPEPHPIGSKVVFPKSDSRELKIYYAALPARPVETEDSLNDQIDELSQAIVTLWESSESHILIALDMTQVDSDREWSVYLHRPYERLEKKLLGALDSSKLAAKKNHVFVLTASADGQRSWFSEVIGSSVFAHFLRDGLTKPTPSQKKPRNLSELCGFVQRNVRQWSVLHRDSVQTPRLIASKAARAQMEAIRVHPKRFDSPADAQANGSATAVEGETAADESVEEKSETVADKNSTKPENAADKSTPEVEKKPTRDVRRRPESPLDRLIEAWEKHQALMSRKPWRYAPNLWRHYEDELLDTEWNWRLHQQEKSAEWGPNFEPFEQKRITLNELADDLTALLDRSQDDSFETKPSDSASGQAKLWNERWSKWEKEVVDHLTTLPEATKEPDGKKAKAPPELLSLTTYERNVDPSTQIYRWAYLYTTLTGQNDYFLKDQGKRLTEIVEWRRDHVEPILGADQDPRGIDSWRTAFTEADRLRRIEQDKLFLKAMPIDISAARSRYDAIGKTVRDFEQVRDVFEDAAWKLPRLVDAACRLSLLHSELAGVEGRRDAHDVVNSIRKATDDFVRLRRRLEESPARLTDRLADLEESMASSLAKLDSRIEDARIDPGKPWIVIDSQLRRTWLMPEERHALLSRFERGQVKEESQTADDFSLTPSEPAEDLGSLVRGLVLAEFDTAVLADPTDPAAPNTAVIPSKKDDRRTAPTKLLDAFFAEGKIPDRTSLDEVRRIATESFLAFPESDNPNVSPATEVLARSDASDRIRSMFRPDESSNDEDQGVKRWHEIARKRRFVFQLERLIEDFADRSELGNLVDDYEKFQAEMGKTEERIVPKAIELRFQKGDERVVVEKTQTSASVSVAATDERFGPGSGGLVVLSLKPPYVDVKPGVDPRREAANAFAFDPTFVGVDVSASAKPKFTEFQIRQTATLSKDTSEADIPVLAFFRGKILSDPLTLKVKGNDELPYRKSLRQSDEQVTVYNEMIRRAGMVEPKEIANQADAEGHAGDFYFLKGGNVELVLKIEHTAKSDMTYKIRVTQKQMRGADEDIAAGLKPEEFAATFRPNESKIVWRKSFSEADKLPSKSEGRRELLIEILNDKNLVLEKITSKIYFEDKFSDIFEVVGKILLDDSGSPIGPVRIISYVGGSNEPILLDQMRGVVGDKAFEGQRNRIVFPVVERTSPAPPQNQFLKGSSKRFEDEAFRGTNNFPGFVIRIYPKNATITSETRPLYTFP
jgi:hypothetical protein